MRYWPLIALATLVVGFASCSDDDGTEILPNPPPGTGAGGTGGGSAGGGAGGMGGGGRGGMAGTGGSVVGGSGGAAGCTPMTSTDAGTDRLDAGLLDASSDAGDLDASTVGGVVSFAADIHPIFEVACNPCHVESNSGGHNVGGELDDAYEDAVRLGARLVERIDGGGMPPPDAPPPFDCGADGGGQPGDVGCLTVAQVALVQTWIDQCYPR